MAEEASSSSSTGEHDHFVEVLLNKLWEENVSEAILATNFPPKFCRGEKASLYERIRPQIICHEPISFCKWNKRNNPLKRDLDYPLCIELVDGPYAYDKPDHWYVNFSGPILAGTYFGPDNGQDEQQCMLFPSMASFFEKARIQKQMDSIYVADKSTGKGTPITIQNIRPHAIDEGRYCVSSIVCMEAPSVFNKYNLQVLEKTYLTALAGFRACILLERKKPIHTGNWGCGDYCGDVTVMSSLQFRAAHDAGVETIIYHPLEPHNHEKLKEVLANIVKYELLTCPLQVFFNFLINLNCSASEAVFEESLE